MKDNKLDQRTEVTTPLAPLWGKGLGNRGCYLSEHFTLEEMVQSDTAMRLGIKNDPDATQIVNLLRLCQQVLEPLRQHFGTPIHINSGFRCPKLNTAVGGVSNSLHMQGRAADIPMKPGYLAYIRDHLPHKELLNEGTWIHVAL